MLAQRTNRDVAWDAASISVTNQRDPERLVRETARRGWNFGDNVWRS